MNQTNFQMRQAVASPQVENRLGSSVLVSKIKCFEDYLSNDFCLSCSYFKQQKGHFGTCQVLQNKKSFDGSKKGSACLCYRLKTDLIGVTRKEKLIQIKHNPLIEIYNQNVKRNLGYKKAKKPSLNDEGILPQKYNKTHIHNLPFKVTSEIKKPKSIVYDHQTPAVIIDFALDQMELCKGLMEIVHAIEVKFGYTVTYHAVEKWIQKFKPHLLERYKKPNISKKKSTYNSNQSQIIFETCICGSQRDSWIKIGMRQNRFNPVQRFKCSKCDKKFTSNTDGLLGKKISMKIIVFIMEREISGRSHQEISNDVAMRFRVNISRHSIMNYINHINDDMIDDLTARNILFNGVTNL